MNKIYGIDLSKGKLIMKNNTHTAPFMYLVSMKLTHLIFAAAVLSAGSPAVGHALELKIKPFLQLNAGDVRSSSFPNWGTDSGIEMTMPFSLDSLQTLTLGVEGKFKGHTNSAFSTLHYDTIVDPYLTYAVGPFSVQTEFPLDVLSSTPKTPLLSEIDVTPEYDISLGNDSTLALTLDSTAFHVSGPFTIDVTPQITYTTGPFSTYVEVTFPKVLTSPLGRDLTVKPQVELKAGPMSFEAYCDIGNVNNGSSPITVKPALKVAYHLRLGG